MTTEFPQFESGVPKGERFLLMGALLGLALLCWIYLVVMAHDMSSGKTMAMPMDKSWTLYDFYMMLVMWIIMMAGMMIPSAMPMINLFSKIAHQRNSQSQLRYLPTTNFVIGYLLMWTGFSFSATVLQWGLQETALLSPMMASANPYFSSTLLIAAGIFQWTPYKDACLQKCRTPLTFLMTEWREGNIGALVMGIRHGLFCLGCCWILMCLLFVLGVMNLLWIAALTIFVLLEKITPDSFHISRISGIFLIFWGGWLLFG